MNHELLHSSETFKIFRTFTLSGEGDISPIKEDTIHIVSTGYIVIGRKINTNSGIIPSIVGAKDIRKNSLWFDDDMK